MSGPRSSDSDGQAGLSLGVLEFGGVGPDSTAYRTLFDLVETVGRLESWGYSRLWLAEHHMPRFAWSVPELMLPVLAGVSEHIRVGTACVLLNFHSPLKIAESFRLLEALFPERIDLGVGRGMAADRVARALGAEPPIPRETFATKLDELLGFLGEGFAETHPYHGMRAAPLGVDPPPLWVMSGSEDGARLAARRGCALCCPLFLRSFRGDPSLVETYRSLFRPASSWSRPRVAVAVAGICSEDERETAERRAAAEAAPDPVVHEGLMGSPDEWRDHLGRLRETWQADEVIFLNLAAGAEGRLESYRKLAGVGRTLSLHPGGFGG